MTKSISGVFTLYLGLAKDIYVVALAEFVLALGRFVFPFLSLLLTQKLGLSAAEAGMWVTVVALSSLPGSFIGGKLSDHFSRKSIIVCGQAIAAAVMLACGFFATSLYILPLLFVAGFAMGMAMPAIRALLADLSTPSNRDAVMSLSYLAFNMGFAIGPLIAGLLFVAHTHWLFWLDGLATFISMLLVIFFLSGRHHIDAKSALEQAVAGSVWLVLTKRPYLIGFTALCTVLSLAIAQFFFAVPLYLVALFKEQGSVYYGQVMTLNALLVVLLTPLFTLLMRRYSALAGIAIAAILLSVCYGIMMATHTLSMFFLAVFFMTAGEILIVTKSNVFIANHSPSSHRGRINGVLPSIIWSGNYLSPVLMGGYIQHFGFQALWFLMIIIAGLSGLCFWLMSLRQARWQVQVPSN